MTDDLKARLREIARENGVDGYPARRQADGDVLMFTLVLECWPGSGIDSASEKAQQIADLLGISVEFDFNGVKCHATPGGDAVHLAQSQQVEQGRKLERPLDRRFATSRCRIFAAKAPTP